MNSCDLKIVWDKNGCYEEEMKVQLELMTEFTGVKQKYLLS